MIKDEFASVIKAERLNRNLSQAGMAQELGTSQTVVSQWERGARKPYDWFFIKFCDKFDYRIEIENEQMTLDEVAIWCRKKRKEKKLTQIELSEMCGGCEHFIATTETVILGLHTVDRVINALGYDAHLVKIGDKNEIK